MATRVSILCRVGLHRWHHYRTSWYLSGPPLPSDYRKRCIRQGCDVDRVDNS